MSLILHPVVIAGDRVSWDRELSPLIAAYLRMMAVRCERQYHAITGEAMEAGRVLTGAELSRLRMRWAACMGLITGLDQSWAVDDWDDAVNWVDELMRTPSDNPGTSPPKSYPDSDSERPGPGT